MECLTKCLCWWVCWRLESNAGLTRQMRETWQVCRCPTLLAVCTHVYLITASFNFIFLGKVNKIIKNDNSFQYLHWEWINFITIDVLPNKKVIVDCLYKTKFCCYLKLYFKVSFMLPEQRSLMKLWVFFCNLFGLSFLLFSN